MGLLSMLFKNRLPTPVKKNPYTKILKQGGWTPIQKLRYESDHSVDIKYIEFLIDAGESIFNIEIYPAKHKYLYARYILGMYIEVQSEDFKLSYIMYDNKGFIEEKGRRSEPLFIGYRNLKFKE